MVAELTQNSIDYITNAPLEKRKHLGQYMTPKSVSDIAIEHLPLKTGDKILDPAVGTGELLLAVKRKNEGVELYGWDIDSDILKVAEQNLGNCNVFLKKVNALETTDQNVYDSAIVNPPYFELTPTPEQRKKYSEVIKGRVNIYSLFFHRVIELVKSDGYIVFIVPPSMNNGSYFNALREYITKNTEIRFIKVIQDSSLFIEAQTSVQIIVLQKKSKPVLNTQYVVDMKEISHSLIHRYIFSENTEVIKDFWVGKKSLYDLGFTVFTGTLVWNQHKPCLSPDQLNDGYVNVYYSKDITKDGLIMFNDKMNARRYMNAEMKKPSTGEAIIVNRIVGGVGLGNIRAALVDGTYFAENHVNVIIPQDNKKQLISLQDLHTKIIHDVHVKEYLRVFTGNTQISSTELKYFIPFTY